MAKKGLKFVVAAPVETKNQGEIPTYGKGFIVGRAIEADISISYNDSPLYADGRVVNRDKGFSSGTITYGVDEFGNGTPESAMEVEAMLTGSVYVPAGEGTTAEMYTGEAPTVNEVGTGYIIPGEYPDNGGEYFEAEWVYIVEFSGRGKSSAKTKEGSISWNTPTVEGNVKPVPGYNPKKNITKKARFATESEAMEWLKELANITESSETKNTSETQG